MSGEFRPRDAMLAGYYLLFLTCNWFAPAFLGPEPAIAFGAFLGILSVIAAGVIHSESPFNPFCYGAFQFLMLALVAADLWIAIEVL